VPGVNCQEGTRTELIESLTVTLREALDLNRAKTKRSRLRPCPSVHLYSREKS
jgi:hypothetical protein